MADSSEQWGLFSNTMTPGVTTRLMSELGEAELIGLQSGGSGTKMARQYSPPRPRRYFAGTDQCVIGPVMPVRMVTTAAESDPSWTLPPVPERHRRPAPGVQSSEDSVTYSYDTLPAWRRNRIMHGRSGSSF